MSYLDGISYYAAYSMEDDISLSTISLLRYGILELGGYYNISTGISQSILSPVFITGLTPYTVWQGLKTDWIWETNISLKFPSGSQPLQPSGIVYNGTFVSTGVPVSGTGYYIDYARGRVVFSSPIPSSTQLRVPHALRAVSIYSTDSLEYRKISYDWISKDSASYAASGSVSNQIQAFIPAVFVDVLGYRTIRGLELGGRQKVTEAQLRFDIFSPEPYDQNKLIDILYMMETKSIHILNAQNAPRSLDQLGRLKATPYTYPQLIGSGYVKGLGRFMENCRAGKDRTKEHPLFHAVVQIGLEVETFPI